MLDLTHFTRWITASILQHVDARRQDVPLYIEAQSKTGPPKNQYFECRVGGPAQRPSGTSREMCLEVVVNILASTTIDEKEVYHIEKLLGIASQALNAVIKVYKLGNLQGVDTQELFGCLVLSNDEPIQVASFGRIDEKSHLIQGTAEAHYVMHI